MYPLVSKRQTIPRTQSVAVIFRLLCVLLLFAFANSGCSDSDGTSLASADPASDPAASSGEDPQSLVAAYEPNSMLYRADTASVDVVGVVEQWNGPYMAPEPEQMTQAAAELLGIYPRAYLTAPNQDVFAALGDPSLWEILSEIGITLMHPIAFEQAGVLYGQDLQPSIDGGYDRIALIPEPKMGTVEEVQALVKTAESYGALIAGDLIPLHTGYGYDFRLAEMNYQEYPGIYDMIEIPREHWSLLPPVQDQWGYTIIHNDQAQPLIDLGLMPGRFDVLLGWPESTDWSGWAATSEITGVDGKSRRWIYAHLFKPEQPTVNWMDPTYAGRRVMAGDIVRHVVDYGTRINRLDAVPFLGLEPEANSDQIAVYNTQLAINGTDDLAFLSRKLGGWTWVELNSPTDDYKRFMENGPDVGYDFFTRAQTVHPLITGDARILRVAHRSILDAGVDYSRLIHALQNHDEIAYQLINLRSQDQVQYGNETISGTQLADRILSQMQQAVAPPAAPYNALYRPAQNGIATTYAGFIGPALGINPYQATPDQIDTIKKAHVMLAVVNAMQPGVFALSQWDLVGALPIDRASVQERIKNGDFRWLNRGAVDLMGVSQETQSVYGLPKAQALYGPLPQQMSDPNSFANQVAKIIRARKQYNISDAKAVAAPDIDPQSVFVLLMTLPSQVGGVAVTAANYSREPANVTVDLAQLVSESGALQGTPHEIISDTDMGSLSGTELTFPLAGLSGVTIVIETTGGSGGGGSGDGGSGDGSGSGGNLPGS